LGKPEQFGATMNDTYRRWIRYCETHPQTPTIPGNPPKAQDLCHRCLGLRKGISDSLARLRKIENHYQSDGTNWEVAILGTPATWNTSRCALVGAAECRAKNEGKKGGDEKVEEKGGGYFHSFLPFLSLFSSFDSLCPHKGALSFCSF